MAEQKKAQEQDLNHLLQVRREKLADLQANGKNPFQITKYDVTNHSMEIKNAFDEFEGKEVTLAALCRPMWQETILERNHIKISRNWISAIS